MHGFGTLRPRGQAGAAGRPAQDLAGGKSRPAPAARGARRRERPPRRETRGRAHAHRGAPEADPRDGVVMADTREKGAMTISLLGREFRVGVPEGQEKELSASVEYLNRKMKE